MSAGAAPQHQTFATPEELARDVADWIVARACAVERRFAVCLTGGSTPKRLYQRLATPALAAKFPWERTHWFLGDERFVPYEDERSNFGMTREALLRHVPAPADHIHPIPTGGASPAACAAAYEAELKRFYGAQTFGAKPLFDLTLLGLGENGHIASLFPGSPTLAERTRWVLPVVGESSVDRITLTYPALEQSAVVAFLVTGERKRDVLARVRDGDPALPAVRLRPAGELYWFTDRAADPYRAARAGERASAAE
jgi:6-phosphogluconolactonase